MPWIARPVWLSVVVLLSQYVAAAEPLQLQLRQRVESAPAVQGWNAVEQPAAWDPVKTAIVICDMWDKHWCPNATERVAQMAPRMNEVVAAARQRGVLIIHCPSDTLQFYESHPARKRAQAAPVVEVKRPLERWCHIDPAREPKLPIDDADGGCDCDEPVKNYRAWSRQIATIEIRDEDAITDSAEAYYLMRQHGIENVLVMGVHTNMCVLGRPFSIRQLSYQGLNVALVRDLTDTMYNPTQAPFVSHFTGTDLVVEHIEKHWCPTITSDQLIGGQPFRFPADKRSHVAILLGEEEYHTATTLPKFAAEQLGKDYRVSLHFLDEKSPTTFPGLAAIKDADVLWISARRRPLIPGDLDLIRAHVAAGKPVIGIRTASHAFHLRNKPAPDGLADWPTLDADVFGGNYSNHHGHDQQATLWTLPEAQNHPILKGVPQAEFPGGGGLYLTSPLKPGTTELVRGKVAGIEQHEPVAWTFTRKDGGSSFYTSLGHRDDFERPEAITILKNAVAWAVEAGKASPKKRVAANDWHPLAVPGTWNELDPQGLKDYDGLAWYRCNLTIPAGWKQRALFLYVENVDNACETYFNGVKIGVSGKLPPEYESGLLSNQHRYVVPPELVKDDGPNLVAIRVYDHDGNGGFKGAAPSLIGGDEAISTAGLWQFHTGDDLAWGKEQPEGLPLFSTIGPVPQLSRFATVIRRQAQDKPLSPQQSLDHFKVPDDLQVELVLSEPEVSQPLFMNFDERGRLWVLQYLQYPEPAGLTLLSKDQFWRAVYDKVPEPPPHGVKGKDKITIHEDADGDGKFETHKTFVDGLNIASAFVQGRGGVFVLNPPYLLFYPDQDRDDVPDADPEVLLSGFGIEDTHSVVNSLRWGPDGWLYAAQGSTVTANVKRPGDKNGVVSQGQNIWRYHPETKRYEIFSEGGGNAFGVEIDAEGRVFSGHNGGNTRGFHYQQGAYLQKGFGKHGPLGNPYAFGYFPAMEHGDYARFTHTFVVYEGQGLPEKYVGKIFAVNPITSHVIISERIPIGSTFKTKDVGLAIDSADSWFRPVDIKDGPDGALYVADWYDGQLAHTANYQGGIDKEHGRIYRIKSRETRVERLEPEKTKNRDLAVLTTGELLARLESSDRWLRQTALRLLADRPADEVAAVMRADASFSAMKSLETICLTALTGQLASDEPLALSAVAEAKSSTVREWAIRLLCDGGTVSPTVASALAQTARSEADIEVLCQLASSAKRLSAEQGLPIVGSLLRRSAFIDDPRLPLLIWWAVEAQVMPARDQVLALFQDPDLWREPLVEKEILPRLMRRFAATGKRDDLAVCASLLKQSPGKPSTEALMRGFEEAFQGRSLTGVPPELVDALAKAGGGSLALKIRQGDAAAIAEALAQIANEKTSPARRAEYIQLFGEVKHPPAVDVLLKVLGKTSDDGVKAAILSALPAYGDDRIPPAVLRQYGQMTEDVRSVAQSLLVSRKASALALLEAVERGDINAKTLPAETVRKLTAHRDDRIAALVNQLFGSVEGASTTEMQAEFERGMAALSTGGGDPYLGKPLYMQSCGKCHQLHDKGGQIGPNLTSFKRDDSRSMLISVVNPSAEIREGFENLLAVMDDGRIVQGFLVEQDPQVVILRTTDGQTVSLERTEIEELLPQKKSLMPEGLLKDLSEEQLRHLFAYLRTTQPLND